MDDATRPALRWARAALAVGALLLAAAVALVVWDAASDDPAPAVVTGRSG